jgi:Fungal specific transcription factor domain
VTRRCLLVVDAASKAASIILMHRREAYELVFRLQINCLYTPDPLEGERESFSVGSTCSSVSCPPGPSLSGKPLSGVISPFGFISSLVGCSAESAYTHTSSGMADLDEQVARHVWGLITGNGDNIDSICHRYFQLVEKWMPIVDRANLSERLGTLQTTPSASFSTLLLTICIFTQASSDQLDRRYYTAKLFLSLLQSTGRLSEEALQANVLIAIYELSQSLHEAAELSIGICARVGMAMGLHRTLNSRIPTNHLPLRDVERQRRIWWCIIIIERYDRI